MELILVRHGQSEENISGKYIADSPLTALGRQQAECAGRAVAAMEPDILAASPLQRALQTATAAAKLTGQPIEVWKNACEYRTGPNHTGPTIEAMCESFPEAIFNEEMEPEGWVYVSDRDMIEARQRAERLLIALKERYAGKRVAIFLHGTLNQLLLQSILGLPNFEDIQISQPNGCIHRIQFEKDFTFVRSITELTHLIMDGVEIS